MLADGSGNNPKIVLEMIQDSLVMLSDYCVMHSDCSVMQPDHSVMYKDYTKHALTVIVP